MEICIFIPDRYSKRLRDEYLQIICNCFFFAYTYMCINFDVRLSNKQIDDLWFPDAPDIISEWKLEGGPNISATRAKTSFAAAVRLSLFSFVFLLFYLSVLTKRFTKCCLTSDCYLLLTDPLQNKATCNSIYVSNVAHFYKHLLSKY